MAPHQRFSGAARVLRVVVPVALTIVLLAGLAAAATGGWLVSHLGTSGSARFSTAPDDPTVIVIGPDVLARTETPVTVRVRAGSDTALWAGLSTPVDATAALGDAERTTVTGVTADDWRVETTSSGLEPAAALNAGDVWSRTSTGEGSVELTIARGQGAQTLVVTSADGAAVAVDEVSLTWERGSWFFQALLLGLVGLALAVAALWGLVRAIRAALRRRKDGPAPLEPDGDEPDGDEPDDAEDTDDTDDTPKGSSRAVDPVSADDTDTDTHEEARA